MPHLKPDDFVRVTVEQFSPHIHVGTVGVVRGHVVEKKAWKLDVEFLPTGAEEWSGHVVLDPTHLELATPRAVSEGRDVA